MQLIVRYMEEKDIENVINLCNECFEEPLDYDRAKNIYKEFIHDKNQIYLVSEEDGVFAKSFESPGGCAGYNALVFHGTQLYFYDDTKKGVFSFIQVINGDKTLGENIALDIQDELFSIPQAMLNRIRALSVVTSERNEVWFLLPGTDNSHSTVMIYDYLHRAWVKRKCQKIY